MPAQQLYHASLGAALSDASVWLDGLLCFHPIFEYLEQHIAADQLTAGVHRAPAIELDIRYYCALLGLDAEQQLAERRPSVAAYLEHLRGVRAENPLLLMAYAYHLYMGMLSGGQILNKKRRMFAKLSMGVDGSADASADGYRTTMYDVAAGPPLAELKADLRRRLDELGDSVDEVTRRRLLEESIMVFELNNAMIHSIRGGGRVALRKVAMLAAVMLLAVVAYRLMWPSASYSVP